MSRADKIYDINIKRLALLTLPTWLRKPLVGALIYAGVLPVARLLQELRTYRADTTYRLTHNGQVCKLRGVLNDEFDPARRRIRIEDSESAAEVEASTLWMREVGRWAMIPRRGSGAAIVHREGYSGTSGYDFWVTVPTDLRSDQTKTRLRAVINMYKLASKRYTINYR